MNSFLTVRFHVTHEQRERQNSCVCTVNLSLCHNYRPIRSRVTRTVPEIRLVLRLPKVCKRWKVESDLLPISFVT